MSMNKFISILQNSLGDNLLTLSGNVLITAPINNAASVLDSTKVKSIKELVKRIEQEYPFIEVGLIYGLADIEIKFFANQKRLHSSNFLDDFNEKLLVLVQNIFTQDNYSVRVNIFGKYSSKDKVQSFRYLNKKDDVRYLIVDEDVRLVTDKICNPKVLSGLTILAILGYVGYMLYGKYVGK
ncbi:hypothetical protein [uncultured Phascolarctobacterium sp.]|uniref:hypothetical protein n=1 Tax=uncultured Phascolarctobacterium sp. TaxID=512296 RepID=UPI0025DDE334|nr:hypothetical protein [uncultured Phascolarctobacterium sp.]